MTAAAGRVRLELRRAAGAASGSIAPPTAAKPSACERRCPFPPVGGGLGAVGEEGARRACVAPEDVDVALERRVAELGEPEAVLLDEVDREPVAPGRDRGRARPSPVSACSPGSTARSSAVRSPSHTIALPRSSSQWYARKRPSSSPRVRHGAVPTFSTSTVAGRRAPPRPARARAHASARRAGRCQYAAASVGRVTAPLLVRAARRELVERTPVWFMRQAGRSLPEYRAIRERNAFFEVAGTPELCAEVTLQPVRRHGVDAAVHVRRHHDPGRRHGDRRRARRGRRPRDRAAGAGSMADVERLRSVRRARSRPCSRRSASCARELDPERALVGFCGGPFTVAGYLVEGRPSRDFARTKALMYREPAVWHALMEKLAEQFARYVAAQVRAGADVDPALRLVGRRAVGRRLRGVRRAVFGAGSSRPSTRRRSISAPA